MSLRTNVLVWQFGLAFNSSLGIIPLMLISPPPAALLRLHAGVQGEALWEEVRVVPDRVVRGQLVQDQRPGHQLHRGEHGGGR